MIRKFGSRTFAPAVGDDVIIKQDGDHIFSGIVTEVTEQYDTADYVGYRVVCTDDTYRLDGRLVNATFEDMTVNAIIAQLKTDGYIPGGFTINGVNCTEVVEQATFKYEPVSQVLTQLAELVGADWYMDYYRDIHFYMQNTVNAPFNLSDTGGKYIYESLVVRRDQTQVRNVVYVRGGDYLANTVTAVLDGNGAQRFFPLPYKMSNVEVTVTGATKSLGIDPIDDPTLYDALHNFQEKMIKFREDRAPRDTSALAASQKIRVSGNPNLPILVVEKDYDEINTFTAREYFIEDRSIQTKEAARQRALAELAAYKTTIAEAEFSTYETNLHVGQKITVQSTLRGLNEQYVISRIVWKWFSEDAVSGCTKLVCDVQLVTTRTFGFTQLLQRLLNRDKKKIILDGTEILDSIHDFFDTASGVDSAVFSGSDGTSYRWGSSSRVARWNFATWS